MESPIMQSGCIDQFKFGSHYSGEHNVWAFSFNVKEDDLYYDGSDPCGILHSEFDNVPILLNLNETAKIPSPMFFLNPVTRNIYFEVST